MLKYKVDVLELLKSKGYSTYKIRKENILGQATITYLNQGKIVGVEAIDRICTILECQISDIIEWYK